MWLFAVPVYVFVLAFTTATWVLIVLAVGALVGLVNTISLSIRIRRQERRG
jgi:hypothetical protein